MEKTLVSIIIPTYKRKETLKNAIDAALGQSYENIEIIVVNDNGASSEFTPIVERIMQQYENNPKVTYLLNEKNLGGAGARNEGIKRSKGDYLAFLDDDDKITPDKIEKQLALFQCKNDDKLALVYCYADQIDEKGNVTYVFKNRMRGNCLYKAMTVDCVAATSLWLVRKDAVVDVGMFSIVPCKQDSTLILKLLLAGYKIDYVPESLCIYSNFIVGDRISVYGPKNIQGELLYLEKCRAACEGLSKQQKDNVEYAFAKRLWNMYQANGIKDEAEFYKHKLMEIHPIKTIYFLQKKHIKWKLRKIKRKFIK